MDLSLKIPYYNPAKGADVPPLLTDDRAQLAAQPYPWWYHAAKQGKVYHAEGAVAGVVLPIYSNTAQVFGIWNLAGSGVNVVLCNLALTYVSTTGAAGGYILAINRNIGNSLATGGISAFTDATNVERVGFPTLGQGSGKTRVTISAATTIAPIPWKGLGMNQLVITATDATTAGFERYREFNGDYVVPPGCAVWIAGNIANLTTYVPSITWMEDPI